MRSKTKHRNTLFNHVEHAVNRSIYRLNLLCTPQDTAHAHRINQGLERLRSAIVIKNNVENSIPIKSTQGLSKETVEHMTFLSYDEMLDVEISGLPSLKTALEQRGLFF